MKVTRAAAMLIFFWAFYSAWLASTFDGYASIGWHHVAPLALSIVGVALAVTTAIVFLLIRNSASQKDSLVRAVIAGPCVWAGTILILALKFGWMDIVWSQALSKIPIFIMLTLSAFISLRTGGVGSNNSFKPTPQRGGGRAHTLR